MTHIVHAVAATKAMQSIAPTPNEGAAPVQETGPLVATGEAPYYTFEPVTLREAMGWAADVALKQLREKGVLPEDSFVMLTFKPVDMPDEAR